MLFIKNYMHELKSMIKQFILYFVLLLAISGCKKDPQIIHKVLDIKAGDSTSPGVHYVRVNYTFNGWSNAAYLLDIDKTNPYDFYFSYYYYSSFSQYGYGLSADPASPNKSAFVYLDSVGYPIPLQTGELISDTLHWVNNKSNISFYEVSVVSVPGQKGYNSGLWYNIPEGYLAFKIVDKKTSLTYKGWIKIVQKFSVSSEINGYAYVVY